VSISRLSPCSYFSLVVVCVDNLFYHLHITLTPSRNVGTVISLHPEINHNFTSPIITRLRQRDTLLRTSADPSLLVQSLLDLGMHLPAVIILPFGRRMFTCLS
jgi:hypothetical protein